MSETSTSYSQPDGQEREYLEQKYGHKEAHLAYTKQEVEKMVDKVLETNDTVKYLIESLRLGGCAVGRDFFQVR